MLEINILTDQEIQNELKNLNGWEYKDSKLTKEFEFKSFDQAVEFVNNLTTFCNEIDHHPDIHIYYKKIRFELQRFDLGAKVTDKDFMVAREIERLFAQLNADPKDRL